MRGWELGITVGRDMWRVDGTGVEVIGDWSRQEFNLQLGLINKQG